MKSVGRLVALVSGGFMIASILGTVAALAAKRRIVEVDQPDADEITLAAIFGPIAFRSTAREFRGGTVDCWYGGGVIDLRGAVLDPAGARLAVRAIFGGAQIVIPESWLLTSNVVGLGGLNDGRPAVDRPDGSPHLTIEGMAMFGGYNVVSEVSEKELAGLERAVAARKAGGLPFAPQDPQPAPGI